jgi:hypothetical protein
MSTYIYKVHLKIDRRKMENLKIKLFSLGIEKGRFGPKQGNKIDRFSLVLKEKCAKQISKTDFSTES